MYCKDIEILKSISTDIFIPPVLEKIKKFKLKLTHTRNNCYVVVKLFQKLFCYLYLGFVQIFLKIRTKDNSYFAQSYQESFIFVLILVDFKLLISESYSQQELPIFTFYIDGRPTCCFATSFVLVLFILFRTISKLNILKTTQSNFIKFSGLMHYGERFVVVIFQVMRSLSVCVI